MTVFQRLFTLTLLKVLSLALLILLASVHAAPPDLTADGVIATIDRSSTYNLGPTGMRGWIYISRSYGGTQGDDNTMTDESRQILVTVASTPANAEMQVDDVILGVDWGSGTGAIPYFTTDARKAFGNAITQAEKAENNGILRIKRWRAGTTTDVSITLLVMGTYADTAPYTCPKSSLILANARNRLVSQLLANSNYLNTGSYSSAIHGLALLAGVQQGDPDYAAVQTRLQTYARSMAATAPPETGLNIWPWGYDSIFLAEYYLRTVADGAPDSTVLPGLNAYALKLAQSQSMFGTFGHGPAIVRPDGTGRMSVGGYGPVNSAGVPANLGIVMLKKALIAGGQAVDPQINAAIQRSSDFFAWYVNKGSIPYGEHHPGAEGHGSNGKDTCAAVFFSQQDNRLAETEYFTRMSVAGFLGREYGHTGQGFSYLWEGMAANVGGPLAVAEYFKPVRWHLDLTRRTDGSYAYDGEEQYGGGSTSGGTYLGSTSYYGVDSTASIILSLSVPLQRLYITGRNANPAHTLDSTKVANAIAAATYKLDRASRTTTQLIGDLSEFDPVVRNFAAKELAARTLTSTELTTLRTMLSGTNANGRMGACQTLGLRKDATAMTMITDRLNKTIETDPWVRATAANALRDYGTAANSQVNTMLTRFVDNSADPDTIVWSDPLQASNGKLSWALFDSAPGTSYFDFGATAITAAKNLLYPAVSTGFKHPDSAARQGPANFAFSRMPIGDVQAMPNDFINLIQSETQCDRMWSAPCRQQGIRTLSKYKFFETMPLGLSLLNVPENFEHGSSDYVNQALTEIATFGESARWTLPTLRSHLNTWDPGSSSQTALVNAINTIEAATTSPTSPFITYLKAAANGQVLTTGAGIAKAITLTGSSCREPSVAFTVLTQPSNGTLTGTAPNLIYTPNAGYTGPDHFTFRTADTLTTSEPATVGVVVGTAGIGLKGEYFDNANFTNPVLTRTDSQINFDWGTGSPHASINADTFSVRWSGLLLVPETCAYTFSALSNDGVRLYINGVPVIDNFVDQNSKWTDSIPIQLAKGQMVEIQMEYYENTASAAAKLKWTGPSVAGITGAIIPQAYLFDGSGIANRTPYAHAQTVSTLLNTAKAITLSGSGGTLTYAVLTQPANGTLTGTAPYLTYTPASSFNGTDSFTFLVNNGTGNSSPATVSISVAAGLPVTSTWASAISANMSAGASWVGGTAPPAAGLAYGNLNFAPTGTYTATHDLDNGFKLNQLNFSGTVTIAGTNSLSFSANGGTLPRLNQNSANAVTVSAPLELAATTTFGGSYGGKVTLGGLISGSGGLVKTSPGTLQINNFNNTYTGGTILDNGTVTFPAGNGSVTPHFGTGPITINANANLSFNRTVLSNAMILNGCTISGGNSFSSVFNGPVTLSGIITVNMGTTGGFQISGNVSGTGGITTVGTTQWTMNGSNSYTGPTTIQAGTIRYQAAAALAPGVLNIATGGKANLNYNGNRVVASLTLGGIDMPPGSYGSSASSATFKNDGYFTSPSVGTITVLPATTTALALTSGSNPSNPGTPLTFTATMTGSNPTGNVAFYDNSTLIGTSALNGSYQATLITSSLASGSHNITAQYQGNATNASSTSSAVAIVINNTVPAAPANLVATAGNNRVTLTWTASAGANGYYVKRSLTNGGPYTLITSSATVGYTDLTAANGTTYYYVLSAYNEFGESANSAQTSATPSVQPSATSVVSSPVGGGTYGDTVTFTSTVSVSGATATGMVTFRSGGAIIGTGTLSGGVATLDTGALAVASHSITATYGGDDTYASSVSLPMTYTVSPKPLSITGVTASDKVYDGTTSATLGGGAISGSLVGSDVVTVVPGSGAFASPNAGTWAVTASGYGLGGNSAGNYALSAQPTVVDATITPRPIQITGTRTYDGTTTAQAGILTLSNNLDAGNLSLTGSASLAGKDAGSQEILTSIATPACVQSATGHTGASAAASYTVTMNASPTSGNTLVAVITTRGNSPNRVSGISQTGVTWAKAPGAEGVNTNASAGSTTEIWYSSGIVAGAGNTATIQFPASTTLLAAAVIAEYSGVMAAVPLDQTANSSGNGPTASTGTTPLTTQASELWIGGIGLRDSTYTLGTPSNAFTTVASANSTSGTSNTNAKAFLLEHIATSSGQASSSGTITNSRWSGAIATFKAATSNNLALTGSAAANYTLTGMTGSVTVSPKALTLTGLSSSSRNYNGTAGAALSGTHALPAAEAPGTGTTSDGKPYTGDTLTLSGTAAGAFATKHVGNNKAITVSGLTLGGAQSGNYTLSQSNGLTANVTQLPVTVTAVTATKTYDGTTTASGTPTLSPALVSGDATTALSQAFENAAAGINKTIIPSITIDDGNSGANYALTLVNFTTAAITPKNLIVTGLSSSNRAYDGTTTAALTGTPALLSAQTPGTGTAGDGKPYTGDSLNLSGTAAGSFTTKHIGSNKQITVSGLTLGGDQTGNYTLIPPTGLTASVAQLPVTVSAVNATKTYDGTTTASGTPVLSPAPASGDVTTVLSQAFENANAGTSNKTIIPAIIIDDGNSGANYALTLVNFTTGTITRKSLTVTGLASSDRNYNGTTSASLTGTPALLAAQAPGTGTAGDGKPYTGDDLLLSGAAAGNFADKHVGDNKPMTVTGLALGGTQSGNYTISPPADLTANVTQLPITVTAVNATKTYDGTTAAAGTPTLTPSLAAGDFTTLLAQAFQDTNAGINKVIVPAITINDGNNGANYAVTPVNFTTGTINKAPATVTLGSLSQTYTGSAISATATTDPAGKTVLFTYDDSSTPPTAVGSYAVIATIDDINYSGTASGTLVIAPESVPTESIADWQIAHFTASEISAGIAADNADADGDGLTNQKEYVLGADPRAFSSQPLAIAPVVGGNFTLSFTARRATGTGYAGLSRKYTVEGTANPANAASWQPVTGYTNLVGATGINSIMGDDQNVVVTMPVATSARFFRLNVRLE